jgi:hypothetical protein
MGRHATTIRASRSLTFDANTDQTFPIAADSNSSCIASNKKVSEQPIVPKVAKVKNTPVKHVPRRSTRNHSAPLRLGYDGQQGQGYNAELDGTSLEWLYGKVAECHSPPPLSYEASVRNPDT